MTQDKARKAAARQRMAETGEPYSVARRAVQDDYDATSDDHDASSDDPRADWNEGMAPAAEGAAPAKFLRRVIS